MITILVLLLSLAAAGAEASAALATIAETATMHAHLSALKREAAERVQNSGCSDASMMLSDYYWDQHTACSDDPAVKELEASVSLATEARSRIGLMQVDFYREVHAALYFKDRVLFQDHGEVWGLHGCFDCVLRSERDELTCRIFKDRMAAIQAAVLVVAEALPEEELLKEYLEPMMTYLRRSRVRIYAWEPGRSREVSPFWSVFAVIFVMFCVVYDKCCTEHRKALRPGRGRYSDGCCSICLEDASIPWTTATRCEHSFHAACMDKLLARGMTRCPLCMQDMFVLK